MKSIFPIFLTLLTYANAGFIPPASVVPTVRAVQPAVFPAQPFVSAYSAPVAYSQAYPQAYTYSQQVAYQQPLAYAQPAVAYAQPALRYPSSVIYRQSFTHPVYYTSPLLSAPSSTVSIVTSPQGTVSHLPQLPAAPQFPQLPQFPQQPQQPQAPQLPQVPQGPSQGGPLPIEPADDSNSANGPQFPPAQQPTFSPPPSEGTSSDEDTVSIEAAIR